MKECPEIAILLSSFNGEKYIKDQLDSLLTQEDVGISVIVRDDGSSDSTLSILHDYKNKYPDIFTIISGDNIGWQKSFFFLIDYASKHCRGYRYFAFCDQDDIWRPDKLIAAVKILGNSDDMRLYSCNLLSFHDNGSIGGKVLPDNVSTTYKNCILRNYAFGCTIVMNSHLLHRIALAPPSIVVPHDHWAYMVATFCGTVIFDKNPHILYRQHKDNAIGIRKGLINTIIRRTAALFRSYGTHTRENYAKELLTCHMPEMRHHAPAVLYKIVHYRETFAGRLALLMDKEFSLDKKSSDFWLKLRIISGSL